MTTTTQQQQSCPGLSRSEFSTMSSVVLTVSLGKSEVFSGQSTGGSSWTTTMGCCCCLVLPARAPSSLRLGGELDPCLRYQCSEAPPCLTGFSLLLLEVSPRETMWFFTYITFLCQNTNRVPATKDGWLPPNWLHRVIRG